MPDLETEWFRRGDPGYERARRAAVAIAPLPDRYPDEILRPASAEAVADAVRDAARAGRRVGIRSGGHSFSASFLRNGGVLLDLSRLDRVDVDADARTAWVQPAVTGAALSRDLLPRGLFFPTDHCSDVGLGGYLLQGGFGWNSRVWGPAVASVRAIDVVTADGALVRASERENEDLLWAARGAGAGFFGVVTRFELALQERRPASSCGIDLYGQRSLPQIAARVTRTSASVGSISRASGTSSMRTSPAPYISVARMGRCLRSEEEAGRGSAPDRSLRQPHPVVFPTIARAPRM